MYEILLHTDPYRSNHLVVGYYEGVIVCRYGYMRFFRQHQGRSHFHNSFAVYISFAYAEIFSIRMKPPFFNRIVTYFIFYINVGFKSSIFYEFSCFYPQRASKYLPKSDTGVKLKRVHTEKCAKNAPANQKRDVCTSQKILFSVSKPKYIDRIFYQRRIRYLG